MKNCAHPNLSKTQICGTCEAPIEWQHHGLCNLSDPDLMFPDETNIIEVTTAKEICRHCPVKGYCLELGWSDDWGIWAGFTTAERKRLRKVFSFKGKTLHERRLMIRTIAHRL